MKITGLRPFTSRDRGRPRVIVAIDTDEGITGWSECYNRGPDRTLPPLLEYLNLHIEGEDPSRIDRLILKLLEQSRELRPDRPGWGVEMNEDYPQTNRFVHWEHKVPTRPDDSTWFTLCA